MGLRAYSWICAQGSLLLGNGGAYVVLGIKLKLAICKASLLSTVLLLWPQIFNILDFLRTVL